MGTRILILLLVDTSPSVSQILDKILQTFAEFALKIYLL